MINPTKPKEKPELSLKLDPLSTPCTSAAFALVDRVDAQIVDKEKRKRKRKVKDQTLYQNQLSALCSALTIQIINEDSRGLAYQRSGRILRKSSRYKPAFMTDTFNSVVDRCKQAGLITIVLGSREQGDTVGMATVIKPTPLLRSLVLPIGLTLHDFDRLPPPEAIILRGPHPNWFERGPKIDYEDTPETIAMRAEMAEVNEWIAEADLSYAFSQTEKGEYVNTSKVFLTRRFCNGSFRKGGRLFDGFWQLLSKDERRAGLTINDEEVVTLDYAEAGLRLAYGHAQVGLPAFDLYSLPGFDVPRQAVKKLFNMMLNTKAPPKKMPSEIAPSVPKGVRVGDLTSAIMERHRGIADLFYTEVGLDLMRMESDILVSVLGKLSSQDVVALPVHDAVVVGVSQASVARQVMKDVFHDQCGLEVCVRDE